jgi:hypothetical protein
LKKEKKKVSAQVSRRLHRVLNLLLAISSEKKKGKKNIPSSKNHDLEEEAWPNEQIMLLKCH